MTDGRSYRFETERQLSACLRVPQPAHVRLAAAAGDIVQALDGRPSALVALPAGRIAWIDEEGALRRDAACAGPTIGAVRRLVASGDRLWAMLDETAVIIDADMLQRLASVEVAGAMDLAGDGRGGAWVLGPGALLHLDGEGRLRASTPMHERGEQVTLLGQVVLLLALPANVVVVLRSDGTRFELALAAVEGPSGSRFVAERLGSDGKAALLTGAWDGVPGYLSVDDAGAVLAMGVWEGAPPALVLPSGDDVLAAVDSGGHWVVRRFAGAAAAGGEVWLTPALESDTLAGGWRRAELSATLPKGATLSVRFAATTDEAIARIAGSLAADAGMAPVERRRRIEEILPWCEVPIAYAGEQDATPPLAEAFGVPLGSAEGNYLWIELTLSRNLAPARPGIQSLIIHHDVAGLTDYLPAVFRTPTGDADGTLRRLIDVFESTYFGFDAEIARLADRLDPARTEDRWLSELAALLDLPFDDALEVKQQRRLLQAGARIIEWRGTRAGVRILLEALFGDRPFRVVDRTGRLAAVALGGGSFVGGRLPGFLQGASARTPKLNARLVLGRTPITDDGDPCRHPAVSRGPELLVVIPATEREQRRLGAAVRQMIEAVLPAGVRLTLRWTGMAQARGGEVLSVLGEVRRQVLGGDPLGSAGLGGPGGSRMREGGIPAEYRLT